MEDVSFDDNSLIDSPGFGILTRQIIDGGNVRPSTSDDGGGKGTRAQVLGFTQSDQNLACQRPPLSTSDLQQPSAQQSMKFALRSASFIATPFVLLLAMLAENAFAAPALGGVNALAERQFWPPAYSTINPGP